MKTINLSNWKRWGTSDERGTLNFIQPDVLIEAASNIKKGKVYPLAIPVCAELSSPIRDGALHIKTIRHDKTKSQRQVSIDVIALHTHDFSHMDSLAHIGYEGFLYNGIPAESVNHTGAEYLGIDKVGAIVGRAILVDIAKYLNVEYLESGFVITPELLEKTLSFENVTPKTGDILLVRTGWINPYMKNPSILTTGWPGLGVSTIEWLYQHSITAVGCDNVAVEVSPFEDKEQSFYFHEKFIRDMGGYLLEFLNLEELASDKVYESFFVAAPLRLKKGLGSPVTPIAIG